MFKAIAKLLLRAAASYFAKEMSNPGRPRIGRDEEIEAMFKHVLELQRRGNAGATMPPMWLRDP